MRLYEPSSEPWMPKNPVSRQIAVLMSGGVDSSVTAHLLKKQGWDVLGITMNIPVACETKPRGCCGAAAAYVCAKLKIPHYFVDVTDVFNELIIEPFQKSYAKGHTPNPCIDCNSLLKFSLVWNLVRENFGIEYLATGHYAKVLKTDTGPRLSRGSDKNKDQSYFLYGIEFEKLPFFVLPLGEFTKIQIREIAGDLKLGVAEKPESMELCFAGEDDYRSVLTDEQMNQPGDMTDMEGNKIGTHKGIANYTLGQRRGIGFAGGVPLYVGRIEPEKNIIALGSKEQVCNDTIIAGDVNILVADEFVGGGEVFGKIRSYGNPRRCRILEADENRMVIKFDQQQFAPAPGQRMVLYNSNGHVIAGGTISAFSRSETGLDCEISQ